MNRKIMPFMLLLIEVIMYYFICLYFHMDLLWFFKSKNRFKAKPSWFSFKNTVDEIFGFDDLKPAIVYSITAFKKLINDKNKRGIN